MIIKSFTAESATAALKLVRKVMGGDAIVLKTRQLDDRINGRRVEITACLENASVGLTSDILDSHMPTTNVPNAIESNEAEELRTRLAELESQHADTNAINNETESDSIKDEIKNALVRADFPTDFIDCLISPETDDNFDHISQKLTVALESYCTDDLKFNAGDKVLFVGPAGSGKSSTLGKFAAQLVTREKMKVHLASLDDVKLGAFDEIQNYAEFLGVPSSEQIHEFVSLPDAVNLIDTPSLPADADRLIQMSDKLNAIEPTHVIAVISATTRYSDVERFCKRLSLIKPTHLIITMLDQTNALGGLVAAVDALNIKVVLTSSVAGGMGLCEKPNISAMVESILEGVTENA